MNVAGDLASLCESYCVSYWITESIIRWVNWVGYGVSVWVIRWVTELVSEWAGWVNESVTELVYKLMDELFSSRTIEWVNEWVS